MKLVSVNCGLAGKSSGTGRKFQSAALILPEICPAQSSYRSICSQSPTTMRRTFTAEVNNHMDE
jgi:hypothetical protein